MKVKRQWLTLMSGLLLTFMYIYALLFLKGVNILPKRVFYTLLSTPGGETKTKIEIEHLTDSNEITSKVTAVLCYEGIEYKGFGTDWLWIDAIADLQKHLPENVKIKCCLTCRHGSLCPVGNKENEIFCVKDIVPKKKEDLFFYTEDELLLSNLNSTTGLSLWILFSVFLLLQVHFTMRLIFSFLIKKTDGLPAIYLLNGRQAVSLSINLKLFSVESRILFFRRQARKKTPCKRKPLVKWIFKCIGGYWRSFVMLTVSSAAGVRDLTRHSGVDKLIALSGL